MHSRCIIISQFQSDINGLLPQLQRDLSYPNRRCLRPNTHTSSYEVSRTLLLSVSGGNRTRRALVLNRLNNLITRAVDCRERGRSRNGRTLIHRRRFTSFSRRCGTSWFLTLQQRTAAEQKHRVLSTQKLAYRFINHTPSYPSSLQAFVRRFAGYKERGDSFPHLVEEEILQFFPQNFYRNHRVSGYYGVCDTPSYCCV